MNIISVPYAPPAFDMSPRDVHQITDLIVHHSAGDPHQSALQIDAEHRANGWAMIGYNFVISPAGSVYAARPLEYVPSAAYGRNAQSVNVVLTGNFERSDRGYTGAPTAQAIAALHALALYLHQRIPSIVRTIGHRDVATLFYGYDPADYATACPGSDLYSQLASVRQYVAGEMKKIA